MVDKRKIGQTLSDVPGEQGGPRFSHSYSDSERRKRGGHCKGGGRVKARVGQGILRKSTFSVSLRSGREKGGEKAETGKRREGGGRWYLDPGRKWSERETNIRRGYGGNQEGGGGAWNQTYQLNCQFPFCTGGA